MDIRFHFLQKISLSNRTALKDFITGIFKKENCPADSLDIIFCSDDYLLEINRTHLQHDYYTDIISFNLAPKGTPVTGELYISADRVKDNASTLDVTVSNELHRVIFHGILHFCGYKDKSTKDQKQMREKEDHYLRKYFS